jgi:hypothetical protein
MIILSFSSHSVLKKYARFTLHTSSDILAEHLNRVESQTC